MTKVSVREFKLHLGQHLQNLPVTITSFGKPVGIVITPQESNKEQTDLLKEYVKELEARIAELEGNVHNNKESVITPQEKWVRIETRRCEMCSQLVSGDAEWWEYDGTKGEIDKKVMGLCKEHLELAEKKRDSLKSMV